MTRNSRQYELELPPRASSLIESLRDVGYSLRTALADVVDNSITAGAKEIHLLADTHDEFPAIGVLDDGVGMIEKELHEAMRPGTRSPLEARAETDLGRFGLGLKTASFSQCRRLTVVSRKAGALSSAVWDLDVVAARDRWVVAVSDRAAGVRWVERLGEDGTLVVWEKLDRLAGTSGLRDKTELVRQLDEAASHLEFVFHRFLSGREGARVAMWLNDRPLQPLDPFHSGHPATQHHQVDTMSLGDRPIRIWPVTLPHHDKVKPSEWKRFAGPEGYASNQGFYLYRNRRLIVHGTWFRIIPRRELTKLARVGIDIPNTMDAEWKIDVRKASAYPPPPVRRRLRRIVHRMVDASQRTYQGRGTRQATHSRLPIWSRVLNKTQVSYEIHENHPIVKTFRDALEDDRARDFDRLLRLFASALPIQSLHHDVSATPESVLPAPFPPTDLLPVVTVTYNILRSRGLSSQQIRDSMRSAEPFRTHWSTTADMLDAIEQRDAQ
ncbi:ATP-binding protein [Candidatus Palauibacter sp.]|uniref:ATP-binding protein n=1 Tax=Candidatus Palauibacter sp. TaxID=3101350 RepID=UPI003B51ABB6